jgi:hypothetical protein
MHGNGLHCESVCETIEEKSATVSKPKFNSERSTRDEWESLPDSIEYPMIRYRTHGRKKEIVIVTTLTDSNQYSAEQIAEVYGLRWDIAVGILAYNIVSALKSDAAAKPPESL